MAWHQDALLEEMSCSRRGVSIELAEIFDLLNAKMFKFRVDFRANVGVARTITNEMTDFFAAVAPDLLVLVNLFTLKIIFVLFFFGLVLGVLAAGLLKSLFTAAPPDLATVLTLMNAATPVKVLRLKEIFAAVFANFFRIVKLASLQFQPLYALSHFIPFHH